MAYDQQFYVYDKSGSVTLVTEQQYKLHNKKLREEKEARKEEAIQETIPFEDESVVAGKKYPLLVMPSGLFVYKNEVPPQEKTPESEHKSILFVPNKNKKSGKTIKMHPMTGVVIRSKIADKGKDRA